MNMNTYRSMDQASNTNQFIIHNQNLELVLLFFESGQEKTENFGEMYTDGVDFDSISKLGFDFGSICFDSIKLRYFV